MKTRKSEQNFSIHFPYLISS